MQVRFSRMKLLLKSWRGTNREELIQARRNTLYFEIHKLINATWKTEHSPKLTVLITQGYQCYQLYTKFTQYSSLKVNSTRTQNYYRLSVLSTYYAIIRYWRKNDRVIGRRASYLYILSYDSARREVL